MVSGLNAKEQHLHSSDNVELYSTFLYTTGIETSSAWQFWATLVYSAWKLIRSSFYRFTSIIENAIISYVYGVMLVHGIHVLCLCFKY